jgi:diguanylate cyclase (GGDEF)-like protein/PAS domain S-box-containing protein
MAANWSSPRFSLPDQLALIGLGGVVVSVASWFVLSSADSVMHGTALSGELLLPDASHEVVRLSAIVVILISTLVIQTLYGRHLRATQMLRSEMARVRQMYDRSPDTILTVDSDRRVLYANPQAETLAGKTGAELVGDTCHSGLFDCDEPCGDCPVPGVFATGEVAERTVAEEVGGHHRWLEQIFYPVLDSEGRVCSVVESTRDTTMLRMAQTTIHRMAYYDPLTDLPNRSLFCDRLATALSRARRRDETVAVVFVDLDDFKEINDMLGHGVGDGLLKAVGSRLRDLLREEDTVARQGGDEFTIIARLTSRDDAAAFAERILESLGEGFKVDGHQLRVSASIGIATYPEDGESDVDLIRHADAAMYSAKDCGRNIYRLYTPEMSESAAGRLMLEGELRHALDHDEFELYYQPQVDVRDGSFVGVEALVRWNHPTRGLLPPTDFIELAEQAGFIGEIGLWVLSNACDQARKWLSEGLEFGRVGVNLSAREFVQSNIVDNVARTLERTGLDAHLLELEITETIAMYNLDQVLAILELLRDMGVRVAIDDFGTGYSSMSYLTRFPVQTLKLAQDFMRDVEVDSQSAAIASMLISLSRELGLDMIAEGVETESQLQFLRERGCYIIQGYLFSRPVSSGELGDMLRGVGGNWEALLSPETAVLV